MTWILALIAVLIGLCAVPMRFADEGAAEDDKGGAGDDKPGDGKEGEGEPAAKTVEPTKPQGYEDLTPEEQGEVDSFLSSVPTATADDILSAIDLLRAGKAAVSKSSQKPDETKPKPEPDTKKTTDAKSEVAELQERLKKLEAERDAEKRQVEIDKQKADLDTLLDDALQDAPFSDRRKATIKKAFRVDLIETRSSMSIPARIKQFVRAEIEDDQNGAIAGKLKDRDNTRGESGTGRRTANTDTKTGDANDWDSGAAVEDAKKELLASKS